MNYFLWCTFFALLIVLIVFLYNPSIFRLAKTLYLISRTTPYEQAVPNAPKILILGDSTGYGTGVSDPKQSIAGRIGQDFSNYTIVNRSKNGRTIAELVPIAHEVSEQYELILLQIGGNDILQKRELPQIKNELTEIISKLSQHTDHILMMTSGNVGGASAFAGETAVEYEALTRSYRDAITQLASETELAYIDLFLEPEEDIISQNPKVYLAIDGLHPSAAGYNIWYQTLYPTLESILTK